MKRRSPNWIWAWRHLSLLRAAWCMAAVRATESSLTRSVSCSLVSSSVEIDRTRKLPSSTHCCRAAIQVSEMVRTQLRRPSDRIPMSYTAWMKPSKMPCLSYASSQTCSLSTMLYRFGQERLNLKCCKWLSPCVQQFSSRSSKRSYSMYGLPQRNSIYHVMNSWAKCPNTH